MAQELLHRMMRDWEYIQKGTRHVLATEVSIVVAPHPTLQSIWFSHGPFIFNVRYRKLLIRGVPSLNHGLRLRT